MHRHRDAVRGIVVDVSSWYLIKLYHPFAWVEIAAGMLMAACFAVMWLVDDVSDVVPVAPSLVQDRSRRPTARRQPII